MNALYNVIKKFKENTLSDVMKYIQEVIKF